MAVVAVVVLSALFLLAIILCSKAAAFFFDQDELFNKMAPTMLIHAIVLLIVTIEAGLRIRRSAAGRNSGADATGETGEYPQNTVGTDIVVCESKNVTIADVGEADGRNDHGTADSEPSPLPPPPSEAEEVKENILARDKEFDEFIAKMRRNIQQEARQVDGG